MSTVRFENDSNVYRIIGELNMATVPQLLNDMSGLFNNNYDTTVIDLSEVSRSDSAGLALLLEWLAQAKHNNTSITFQNLPEQMKAIIKVSGLEELISS
ncbi:MAG: STAS domain-containing protein [Gammaproteobacteria bacterium]